MKKEFGLGRLPAHDPRDAMHPLRAITPKRAAVTTRYWRTGAVMDQGSTPRCVAYSWSQFVQSAPLMTRLPWPDYQLTLYKRAQQLDEWPGEGYDGTSVRAGVKALQEEGRITEYLWSTDTEEIRRYVLSRGPVIIGIDWPETFFYPRKRASGMYLENPESENAGGHAIMVLGFSETRRAFRLINSWGSDYGEKGRVWMHIDVMRDRLSQPFAEACSALERKVQ